MKTGPSPTASPNTLGFEIRTVRRCTRIDVSTHDGAGSLSRSYHLIYLDQRGLPVDRLPLNGASLLSQVKVVGHDGPRSEELPPLEFGYTRFEPTRRDFFPISGANMPPGSTGPSGLELANVIGTAARRPEMMARSVTGATSGQGGSACREIGPTARPGLRLADPGVRSSNKW